MNRAVGIGDLDFIAQQLGLKVADHDHLVASILLPQLETIESPMDTRHGAALAASVLYTNLRSQTSLDVLLVFQLTVLQAGLALRFSHPFRLTTTEAKAIFEVAVKIETQLPSSGWDRILSVMVRLLGDAL